MEPEMLILETEETMQKGVDFLLHELSAVRTGKASPALVENMEIHVNQYGTKMRLKQLASINTPEPRLIVITPFDPSTVHDIERGINESRLGISPNRDGKVIRLPIPELTGERRKDLVKMIKGMSEDARIRVRGERREAIDQLKKAQKEGQITEDDLEIYEEEVQKLTNKMVAEVDKHLEKKEKEIMTV